MKEPQEWLVEAKWIAVLVVATFVTAGVGLWQRTREQNAIEGLRQEERRIVYEHAIAPLRSLCANQSRSTFNEYCQQQAEFLLLFPECDDSCRKLAEGWLPRPTR